LGPDAGASFAKVARAFRAHAGNCFCLALDPAKQRLAVGAKDSLVSVWSLDEMVTPHHHHHHYHPLAVALGAKKKH